MNIYPKSRHSVKDVRKFIVIFYFIGTLGFIIPYTKFFFTTLIPYALILNVYLLALFNKNYNKRSILVYSVIFILGFIIEVIGVNTGQIFGIYQYGSGLGLKIFNTPLLIGFNWLFLTYTSCSIIRSFKWHRRLTVFASSLIMCIYDFVLEQAAPEMGMWQWEKESVPLQNYIAWFIIGSCFVFLIQYFKIETRNGLSKVLFFSQFIFLVFITLIQK